VRCYFNVQFVSDGVDAELSELGEDPEVVEETQIEDFVANVVVTPVGRVSDTSGYENTAPVLKVTFCFYNFGWVYINLE
jgi:hypothetical protein